MDSRRIGPGCRTVVHSPGDVLGGFVLCVPAIPLAESAKQDQGVGHSVYYSVIDFEWLTVAVNL